MAGIGGTIPFLKRSYTTPHSSIHVQVCLLMVGFLPAPMQPDCSSSSYSKKLLLPYYPT